MKRTSLGLIAILLALLSCLLVLSVSAEGPASSGLQFTPNGNGTCAVTGIGTCTDAAIVIPAKSPAGDTVTSIGSSAFKDCTAITSVVIPDSVKKIQWGAFYGCTNLASVTIGNCVTEIGAKAFLNCTNLTEVTIGEKVAVIKSEAFRGCKALSYIVIPESVTSIGNNAFHNCSRLIKIKYPGTEEGWNAIEKGSNWDRNTGKYIVLYPVEVTESLEFTVNGHGTCMVSGIGTYPSNDVVIPSVSPEGDIVTSIGSSAFKDCTAITSVTIPDSVKKIQWGAFYGCTNLASITIGNGVTEIGSKAFLNCTNLTDLTIGKAVANIKSEAFRGCSGLTSVTIPRSVTSIGGYAFQNCTNLTEFVYFGSEDGWNAIEKGTNWDRNIRTYEVFFYSKGLEFTSNGNGTCIVSGIGAYQSAEVIIPSVSPEGDIVTSIGSSAFKDCTAITSVTIPDSVKKIQWGAFYGCMNLASVTIGNGVTEIGSKAFLNCTNLTEVTIGEKVATIKSEAFRGCNSLMSITIPESVTSIGDYVFYNCTNLKSITISNSVMSVGSYAFSNCRRLKSITIPDGVTSIGAGAFFGCSSLESMTIPFVGAKAGVTASDTDQYPFGYIFGTSSYTGGTATTQYYYGSSTSSTTSKTYYIPISLKSVTVTGGNILYGAFYNCSGLTSITIGDGVTSIGEQAFYGCSSLESMTIPFVGAKAGVTASDTDQYPFGYIFGTDSYTGGTGTTQYYYGSSTSSTTSTTYYIPTSLKSVTVTGGNILYGAFYNCRGLTSITIGNGVTSIGASAFSGCSSLESMTIPFVGAKAGVTASDTYQYPFGYIFGTSSYTGGTATQQFYYGSSTSSTTYNTFNIPTSLKSVTVTGSNILCGAFSNCRLTSITIPDSVTSIGNDAFYGCHSLTSITIPDSVTSIGKSAFEYCSSLTSITIPDSVTSIGSSAFRGCSSLTSVTIPDSVTSIGEWAFYNCSGLTSVYITDLAAWCKISFGSLAANPLSYAHNLYLNGTLVTDLVIPDSVTSIGSSAFSYCSGLTSITIPDSVTSIGTGAFSGCSSLVSITIPFVGAKAGVTAFDTYQYPFGYIFGTSSYTGGTETKQYYYGSSKSSTTSSTYYIPTSLKSVTVTGGNILYGAFYNCSNLTSITIGNGVTSIGNSAFSGCSNLTSVNWNATNCTSAGSSSYPIFSGCTNLKTVNIGENVTNIPSHAFKNCSSLTSVTIPNSITSIWNCAFYNCSGLTSVYITDLAAWCKISFDDYYANPLYYAHNLYLNGTLLIDLVIPDSVTSIGRNVFCGYTAAIQWGGHPTITTIGNHAFSGYEGTSITIPDSVTSIGEGAFSHCSSLTSITIPDSVTSIYREAFYGCSGLTSVYITDLAVWYNISFDDGYANPLCYAHNLYLNGALVTDLVIPESVTSIGEYAFYGCSGLTSITIPDSVTYIGARAFYDCSRLTSVTIPDSVTRIGSGVFGQCISLKSITIPFVGGPTAAATTGNRTLYPLGYLFDNGKGYSEYEAKQMICNVRDGIFYAHRDTTYYIPYSLHSVTVTGGYIPSITFQNCSRLTNITIGNGVTGIGASAFYGCNSLTSVTIPFLDSRIFDDSSHVPPYLRTVIITGGTSIPDRAFYYCTGLTSITIPNSVTSIGDYAFYYCSGLTSITFEEESQLTSVGYQAFYNCSGLTSITIPNSVTSIGYQAFYNCSGLTSIAVAEGNPQYHNAGNCLIETASKTLLLGCQNSVIPTDGSVTRIGGYAFYNCCSLTSVTIPDSVTSIGSSAFRGCSSLTSVTIPNSVTIIGSDAFSGCSNLQYNEYNNAYYLGNASNPYVILIKAKNTSISSCTIHEQTKVIYQNAFYNCSSLTSVTIPDSITSIGYEAFSHCSRSLISISVGIENTKYHSARNCLIETESKTLILGCMNSVIPTDGSVTSIGRSAFSGCRGFTSITIPNSVTSIGYQAFYNCSGLTSITIPDSVTSISGEAFYGCSKLTSITYQGTIAQWNWISKGYNWNNNTGNYTIHCTNGDIAK